MQRFLVLWMTLLLVSLPLRSQPSVSGQEPIRTRIRLVSMTSPIRGLHLYTGGELEKAWIPSAYVPKAEAYSGPAVMTLVEMTTDGEGGEAPVPVARIPLPREAEEVVVLITPRTPGQGEPEEGQMRYEGYVVNLSRQALPENSFWVWNMTDRPILGTVGEKPLRIPEGERQLIRPDLSGEAKALDAKLLFADDDSQKSYSSSKWFLNPGQRFLMMLFEEEGQGHSSIRLKALKL